MSVRQHFQCHARHTFTFWLTAVRVQRVVPAFDLEVGSGEGRLPLCAHTSPGEATAQHSDKLSRVGFSCLLTVEPGSPGLHVALWAVGHGVKSLSPLSVLLDLISIETSFLFFLLLLWRHSDHVLITFTFISLKNTLLCVNSVLMQLTEWSVRTTVCSLTFLHWWIREFGTFMFYSLICKIRSYNWNINPREGKTIFWLLIGRTSYLHIGKKPKFTKR